MSMCAPPLASVPSPLADEKPAAAPGAGAVEPDGATTPSAHAATTASTANVAPTAVDLYMMGPSSKRVAGVDRDVSAATAVGRAAHNRWQGAATLAAVVAAER
jgi:hypothetical protein